MNSDSDNDSENEMRNYCESCLICNKTEKRGYLNNYKFPPYNCDFLTDGYPSMIFPHHEYAYHCCKGWTELMVFIRISLHKSERDIYEKFVMILNKNTQTVLHKNEFGESILDLF